jgi:hypothetical protein
MADNDNDESLLARKPTPASPKIIEIPSLKEPDIRLDFEPKDGGKSLDVSLNVPKSSGDASKLPFIAVMQDEEINRALSAEMKSRLQDKLRAVAPNATIDVIELGIGRPSSSGNGGKSADPSSTDKSADPEKGQDKNIGNALKAIPGLLGGFEVNFNTKINFNNNPKFEEVKKDLQADFDALRRDVYTERAKDWAIQGGAKIEGLKDANGQPRTARISDIDAINYLRTPQKEILDGSGDVIRIAKAPVNVFGDDPKAMQALTAVIRRHDAAGDKSKEYQDLLNDFNPDFIKGIRAQIRADAGGEPGKGLSPTGEPIAALKNLGLSLDQESHPLNRQYQQALKGAGGDKEIAAVAVEAISRAPGFKPDQDINLVQSKNGGLIVSQGEGPTAINLPVPKAQPGDFERVSTQLAQTTPTQPLAINSPDSQQQNETQRPSNPLRA